MVDRQMARNSGNPDAVAQVPDSVIQREREEELAINARYYAQHPIGANTTAATNVKAS